MYLGDSMKPERSQLVFKFRMILNAVLVFFVITCLSTFPIVYILGEAGPERAWTQISFYMTLLSAAMFFYAGYCCALKESIQQFIVLMSFGFIFTTLVVSAFAQYNIVSKYSRAVDERIDHLTTLKNEHFMGTAELDSLPSAGFLHSNEISNDENAAINQMIKSTMELPFDIKVKSRKR